MFDPERVARVRCSVDERDYDALLALYSKLQANLTRNAEVEAKLARERMASENEADTLRRAMQALVSKIDQAAKAGKYVELSVELGIVQALVRGWTEDVAQPAGSVDERGYDTNATGNAEAEAKLARERMASENELDRMRNRISEAARDYDALLALYSKLGNAGNAEVEARLARERRRLK
jgi:hypothetical protein